VLPIRLSVLDQSPAIAGQTQADAIRETLALARHCEALGYHRYWVSEHHNHDTIVGTAPEILIAAIAATTQRIRVGSAGVMLPNYSALHVAEQFRVLEAIAPGRIDLGLGRAPGTDRRTMLALNPDAFQAGEDFPAHVRDLAAWLEGTALPETHPLHGVRAHPTGPTVPELWILGSSDYGARVAAHFGLPYCFAWFITDGRGAEAAMSIYRSGYQPSERHPEPHAAVCVWALAADTEDEATRLFTTRAKARIARDQGVLLPLSSPQELLARPWPAHELARLAQMREDAFVGTADRLGERLRRLARELQVQEIAVVTWTHELAARMHSYRLLAGEFGLSAA
jgi:luciferase family oxidoreductase group 1